MKITFNVPDELAKLARFDARERGVTNVVDGKTVADVDRSAEVVYLAHLKSRRGLYDERQAEKLNAAIAAAPAGTTIDAVKATVAAQDE
jgi:hypothetical protein